MSKSYYKRYQEITAREIELNQTMKYHPSYGLNERDFYIALKNDKHFRAWWNREISDYNR